MKSGTPRQARPEIELAWHRARGFGLDPGMEVNGPERTEDVDTGSRLLTAAHPVLERMAHDLADSRFSVLLADSTSVIVDWRVPSGAPSRLLERVMAVPGIRYTEAISGTNALATAHELRRGIEVTGAEHYLEALHPFTCYGAPIIHPVTRRLEGVLDVTGPATEHSALLRGFLDRAVMDITQYLLQGSRITEQRILDAYLAQGARSARPVLVMGDDVLLANRQAVDLLRAEDHAMLRDVACEAPARASATLHLRLAGGQQAVVRLQRVHGRPDAVVFEIEPRPLPGDPAGASARTDHKSPSGAVYVQGESGTGRTTAARGLAGAPVPFLGAIDERCGDEEASRRWLTRARTALHAGKGLVVDDVHLLSGTAAHALAQLIGDRTAGVIMTGDEVETLSGAHAALVGRCPNRPRLTPLRDRGDFADLVHTMVRNLPRGAGRRVTPSALGILQAHSWPGNLRELHGVLRAATDVHSSGDIGPSDLPAAYRISPTRRRMSPLEQAEHDTILAVLAETQGNKARAAERLQIGRNTLYERIRRLRIPT